VDTTGLAADHVTKSVIQRLRAHESRR
jgi:hypothetical protein